MLVRLLLLFTIVPLIELALLLWFSSLTNIPTTVALVIVTGILGAALARQQGWQTWRRIQTELHTGQMPADALLDDMLILIAGAVLITPGLLTDLFGFALLISPIRSWLKPRVVAWLKRRTTIHVHVPRGGPSPDDSVLDADFTRRRPPPNENAP